MGEDRSKNALLIAASLIAAVRLAREEIKADSARPFRCERQHSPGADGPRKNRTRRRPLKPVEASQGREIPMTSREESHQNVSSRFRCWK